MDVQGIWGEGRGLRQGVGDGIDAGGVGGGGGGFLCGLARGVVGRGP